MYRHVTRFQRSRQPVTQAGASSKRTRRVKVHPVPEDTPLSLPEDKSMRNLLLGNISEQHTLSTKLFEALSQSLSASRRVNTSSTTLLNEVAEMYTRLEALSEEHAQLVELARKHRDRWERLQRKRKRRQALEDNVRRILVQLQEGRREIEEIVDEGEEVLTGIEMARKGEPLKDNHYIIQALIVTSLSYSCHPGRHADKPRNSAGAIYHSYSCCRAFTRRFDTDTRSILPSGTIDDGIEINALGSWGDDWIR